MSRAAVVRNNDDRIVGVIEYAVGSDWQPAAGYRLEMDADGVAEEGGTHAAGVFVPKAAPTPTAQELISAAKLEAGSRIRLAAPDWKQRNMLARGAELRRKGEPNLTPAEAAEVQQMDAFWQWAKSIRSLSDQLEADVDAGIVTTLDDIAAAAWPPPPA